MWHKKCTNINWKLCCDVHHKHNKLHSGWSRGSNLLGQPKTCEGSTLISVLWHLISISNNQISFISIASRFWMSVAYLSFFNGYLMLLCLHTKLQITRWFTAIQPALEQVAWNYYEPHLILLSISERNITALIYVLP